MYPNSGYNYGYGNPPGAPGPGAGNFGQPGQFSGHNYGQGPPPGGAYGNFGPQTNFGPPPGVNPELWTWFQAVDQDNSGQISADELQKALLNGNWSPFDTKTCRMMIGMFDQDNSGTISPQEFSALWKYISDWKACFDNFDRDRSGTISSNELQTAFRNFGYNLSPNFSQLCVRKFDQQRRGNVMNFDAFIQCCVMLHSWTEAFKRKDTNQSGVIQLNYEDFLSLVFQNSFI